MAGNRFTPLSNTELSGFCSQMAMILKSGISSFEGISIMMEDAHDKKEKELLSTIYDTLTATGSLYQSLEEAGAFPPYFLQMIRIGEQAGRLDEVTASLADYYEKEASLSQAVKNAVTYPLIMILMMVLVILVLIMKVMPVFNQVFRQLGSEMTGFSRALLSIGEFLNRYWLIFLLILVLIAAVFIVLGKVKKKEFSFRTLLDKFRGIRELSAKIASYRFANGMSLTLSSGLAPEECLRLATDLTEEGAARDRLNQCLNEVSEGTDLCEALLHNGVFTGLYARMASIGSRTGTMDGAMRKIASQYEDEIDTRIAGMIAAVEPTLVVILSIIVGIILLSVMLPLMGIMASL